MMRRTVHLPSVVVVLVVLLVGWANAPTRSSGQAGGLAAEAKTVTHRAVAQSDASKSIDKAKTLGDRALVDPEPQPKGTSKGAALEADAAGTEASWKEAGDAYRSKVFRHLRQRKLYIEASDLESLIRMVDSAARRFHLNPLMVLAVIHVESRFNPYAVSPAGSIGLMQLQVDTAREIAARLNIPWTSHDLLFDPRVNILLGTCYLRELLDRFGDPDLALAAFHSGPTRIVAQSLRPGPSSIVYASRVRTTWLELQACTRV